jgi:hypothetical protein
LFLQGTDRREQIDLLVELETIAAAHSLGPAVQVKIGFAIIAALFDYSLKVHEIQKVQYWIKLIDKINEMLKIATESKETMKVRTSGNAILSRFLINCALIVHTSSSLILLDR